MSRCDNDVFPPLQLEKDVYDFLKQSWRGDIEEGEADNSDEEFYNLLSTLSTPPAVTTLRINTLHADTYTVVKKLKEELEKQYDDRGSTLPPVVIHPALKDVLVIPSRGPNKRDPEVKKEVIVDLECGMSVLRGADVFVLGIMGAPRGLRAGDMVAVYADIDYQCRKGQIEEYKERKLFVGCGEMQLSRDQIFCSAQVKLRGVGIKMTKPLYEAPSLDDVLPDLIFAQNLPSIVCSQVLDPQPGETVIDMCAAPGGKTNHIASLMRDKGRVVALDKTLMKVEKITANVKRWDLTCVECHMFDSTMAVSQNADISDGPPYPAGSFDRVLVDVPCSALGRRPAARNKMVLKSLQSFPVYQKKFIEAGVELLKPGGILVYSTCTITVEENEKQVQWALETFPCLRLVPQNPHLGDIGRSCQGLTTEQLQLLQRFDPCGTTNKSKYFTDTDTIGFFIAKFIKEPGG